jgi:hypothetical protein
MSRERNEYLIEGLIERIKVLEENLRKAQAEKNIKKVQIIAIELNEIFEILKKSIEGDLKSGKYDSYFKKGLRSVVHSDKYGKLKDFLDEICNDKYPRVKDTLNCIKTTMFGVGLGGVLLRNIPSQGMTIETVKESFQKDIIGLVAFSTVVELIHRTSLKVLNTAENMLLKYIDNIDIYDIPEFRDLKILSNDIDLIIEEMKIEGTCPICYRNFGFDEEKKEEVIKRWLVPCGHYICKTCIEELQAKNMLNKCPYCQQNVEGVADKKLKEHYELRPKAKRFRKTKSRKSTRKTVRKSKSRKSTRKTVRKSKPRKSTRKTVRKSKPKKSARKTVRKSKPRKSTRKSTKSKKSIRKSR